jgi:hypothetical protein
MHGVSGYNVIRYFHVYYAIPQGEGEFSADRVAAHAYSSSFQGRSVGGVLRQIAAEMRKRAPPIQEKAGDEVSPILAMEGFHGFNIIRFGDQFHAILQSEGRFCHEKVRSNQYSRSYTGDSLAEVMSAIAASHEALGGKPSPDRPEELSTGH